MLKIPTIDNVIYNDTHRMRAGFHLNFLGGLLGFDNGNIKKLRIKHEEDYNIEFDKNHYFKKSDTRLLEFMHNGGMNYFSGTEMAIPIEHVFLYDFYKLIMNKNLNKKSYKLLISKYSSENTDGEFKKYIENYNKNNDSIILPSIFLNMTFIMFISGLSEKKIIEYIESDILKINNVARNICFMYYDLLGLLLLINLRKSYYREHIIISIYKIITDNLEKMDNKYKYSSKELRMISQMKYVFYGYLESNFQETNGKINYRNPYVYPSELFRYYFENINPHRNKNKFYYIGDSIIDSFIIICDLLIYSIRQNRVSFESIVYYSCNNCGNNVIIGSNVLTLYGLLYGYYMVPDSLINKINKKFKII